MYQRIATRAVSTVVNDWRQVAWVIDVACLVLSLEFIVQHSFSIHTVAFVRMIISRVFVPAVGLRADPSMSSLSGILFLCNALPQSKMALSNTVLVFCSCFNTNTKLSIVCMCCVFFCNVVLLCRYLSDKKMCFACTIYSANKGCNRSRTWACTSWTL